MPDERTESKRDERLVAECRQLVGGGDRDGFYCNDRRVRALCDALEAANAKLAAEQVVSTHWHDRYIEQVIRAQEAEAKLAGVERLHFDILNRNIRDADWIIRRLGEELGEASDAAPETARKAWESICPQCSATLYKCGDGIWRDQDGWPHKACDEPARDTREAACGIEFRLEGSYLYAKCARPPHDSDDSAHRRLHLNSDTTQWYSKPADSPTPAAAREPRQVLNELIEMLCAMKRHSTNESKALDAIIVAARGAR